MSNKLLTRLGVMYGVPDTEDPAAWLAEMERMTKAYSETELDKAADLIMRRHRGRYFPAVSEIVCACADAREDVNPAKPVDKAKWPEWEPEAIKKADELICGEMGREAASEGWISGLHDFCRKNGRLPHGREVTSCRDVSRGFDNAYALCTRMHTPLGTALVGLGNSMLKNHEYLVKIANGHKRSQRELAAYLKSPMEFHA